MSLYHRSGLLYKVDDLSQKPPEEGRKLEIAL